MQSTVGVLRVAVVSLRSSYRFPTNSVVLLDYAILVLVRPFLPKSLFVHEVGQFVHVHLVVVTDLFAVVPVPQQAGAAILRFRHDSVDGRHQASSYLMLKVVVAAAAVVKSMFSPASAEMVTSPSTS